MNYSEWPERLASTPISNPVHGVVDVSEDPARSWLPTTGLGFPVPSWSRPRGPCLCSGQLAEPMAAASVGCFFLELIMNGCGIHIQVREQWPVGLGERDGSPRIAQIRTLMGGVEYDGVSRRV